MRPLLSTLALGAAILCAPSLAAAAESRYVVVYKSDVRDVDSQTNALQTKVGFASTFRYAHVLKGFAASLTSTERDALASNPGVAYVAPDITFTAAGMVPIANGETEPVGIRRIQAATPSAVHPASDESVAVLDTGIDLKNSDLNAITGSNCVKTGTAAQDDNGHGTNVAGIIAARNQGTGVVGVAPGTKLYSVKVLNSKGTGTLSQILCGINWVSANAAALNVRVVNMSLVGFGSSDNNCGNTNKDAEHQAICNSTAAGITYVAAAGNNSASVDKYVPAAYSEVLTVTAMTDTDGVGGALGPAPCISRQKDDTYASYSNYAASAADQVHTIAAPGTCVISDGLGGGTSNYYGTSQAAPHVTGSVALCLMEGGAAGPCSGMTANQIIAKIRADAATAATTANGFIGDPLHPVTGQYFGNLVNASGY